MAGELIRREFNPTEWNIYSFQFSDGDNWGEDNEQSLRLLAKNCCRRSICFATGRSKALTEAASTFRALRARYGETHEKLVLSEIEDKEAIYKSIKAFLGKGK